MASSAQPPPSPSISAILDQLDELEALMRRMLTIPVNGEAEEGAVPPSRQTGLPERVTGEGDYRSSAPQSRPAPSQPRGSRDLPLSIANGSMPSRKESLVTNEQQERPAPSARAAPLPRPNAKVPAAGPVVGLWQRPLEWIDHRLRTFADSLGPTGRWLTGERGRAVVGAIGLSLIAAALAWGVYDWLSSRSAGRSTAADAPHLARPAP
jgi:hypothetical protein